MFLTPTTVDTAGRPRSAVWYHADPAVQAVAVWTEMRPGLGEDAEPTVILDSAGEFGLIGVYDGLGGSGAGQLGQSRDGRELSHAFVASRLAHLTVQDWFRRRAASTGPPEGLHACLSAAFQAARPPRRHKLAGTLRRELPTTLATIQFQLARDEAHLAARWAGDSRCYLLTPRYGLQQLSRDDSDVQDALATLIADQPMTNLVSASADFVINALRVAVPLPCVLVCATDGFYNYVQTPAHFELVLLEAIHEREPRLIGARLRDTVRRYTQDDASLALVFLGFDRSPDSAFRTRWQRLQKQHVLRTDATREEFVRDREHSWSIYREQYSYYLRGGTHEGG